MSHNSINMASVNWRSQFPVAWCPFFRKVFMNGALKCLFCHENTVFTVWDLLKRNVMEGEPLSAGKKRMRFSAKWPALISTSPSRTHPQQEDFDDDQVVADQRASTMSLILNTPSCFVYVRVDRPHGSFNRWKLSRPKPISDSHPLSIIHSF